jgi:hypothetical protein
LAYQFQSREYFSFVKVHEFRRWEFDASILFLAVPGIIYFARTRSLKSAALPVALLLGFSPLIITHPTRFFNGVGLMGPALLSGIFLDEILRRWGGRLSPRKLMTGFLVAMAFIWLAGPFFEWNVKEKTGRWVWGDRTVTRYLVPDEKRNFRAQGFSIFFPEDYAQIVEVVRAHSDADDILWTDFSYTAGILGILADRATSCAMLAEVKPSEESNRLKDARIIVWFKDRNARPAPEMEPAVRRHGLQLLKETDMAFIYQNPAGFSKRRVPKPTVPVTALYGIVGLLVALLFIERNRQRL